MTISQNADANRAELTVAAVITYYKADRFIGECVASVNAQTRSPDEFVIVDDEVSEESREVLGALNPSATVVTHPRNLGVSTARNTGVGASNAEWVAFLDSDDSWHPKKLERQIQFIAEHPDVAAVHTGVRVFNGPETLVEYTEKPKFLTTSDTLMMAAALPSSLMIRRDVLDALDGWRDDAGSEDRDLCLRLIEAGHRIGFVSDALVNLRREDHGNVSSHWRPKLHMHLQFYRRHWRVYSTHGMTRAYLEWTFDHAAHRSQGLRRLGFKMLVLVFSLAQGRLRL